MIAATPTIDDSLVIDSCSMVVAKSYLADLPTLELSQLSRYRLLKYIDVAKSPETAETPRVNNSICRYGT